MNIHKRKILYLQMYKNGYQMKIKKRQLDGFGRSSVRIYEFSRRTQIDLKKIKRSFNVNINKRMVHFQ